MSDKPRFPVLRTAAHLRHQALVAACWWWCPPIMAARSVRHIDIVDGFYDRLEGNDATDD